VSELFHDGFETGSHRGSVVVGVDGSDHADRAVGWAARQAVLEHRPLTLLHGFNPIGRTTWGALTLEGTDRYDLLHVLRRNARTMLEDALALAQKTEPDLEVHPVLVDADARTALVDASRTARLLVLGSRGRGSVSGLLLGSVSVAVAQLALCPAVVCRPRRPGTHTHGVLVGADGSAASLPVIEFAFHQAALRGVPLTVMHCFWEIVAAGRPTPDPPSDMQLLLAESVAGFADSYPDVEVHLEPSRGLVDQVLANQALTTELLVVGRRHHAAVSRLLHTSMAAAVLERAAGTVAVVPEAEPVIPA
jgi:nucleotide-binding universal stress UspA family protein